MLELDLVRCASKREVLANHGQRRRPAQAPSMLRRPLTFKSSSAATPLQIMRARYFDCTHLITFLGNPRLQQDCFRRPLCAILHRYLHAIFIQ